MSFEIHIQRTMRCPSWHLPLTQTLTHRWGDYNDLKPPNHTFILSTNDKRNFIRESYLEKHRRVKWDIVNRIHSSRELVPSLISYPSIHPLLHGLSARRCPKSPYFLTR